MAKKKSKAGSKSSQSEHQLTETHEQNQGPSTSAAASKPSSQEDSSAQQLPDGDSSAQAQAPAPASSISAPASPPKQQKQTPAPTLASPAKQQEPASSPAPALASPAKQQEPASSPAPISSTPQKAPEASASAAPKKVPPPKKPSSSSAPASTSFLSRTARVLFPSRLARFVWSWAIMVTWFFLWPRPIKFLVKSIVMYSFLFVSCLYGLLRGIFRPADRRDLNYHASRFYAGVTSFLQITHKIEGGEHLDNQPCVYLLNHQSTLDLLSVAHIMQKNTFIIGKKSLLYVPILGWYAKISQNILIDRENHDSAMKTMEKVGRTLREEKASVLVFPEGTRSRSDGTLLPFKKGSFNLAVGGQVPVVPVVVSNQRPVYNSKKWSFPGGEIKVTVLPPVSTEGLTRDDVPQLAEKVQQLMAQELQRAQAQAAPS